MTRQEQAIENFKRKSHYADPFEYLKQKKQEENIMRSASVDA